MTGQSVVDHVTLWNQYTQTGGFTWDCVACLEALVSNVTSLRLCQTPWKAACDSKIQPKVVYCDWVWACLYVDANLLQISHACWPRLRTTEAFEPATTSWTSAQLQRLLMSSNTLGKICVLLWSARPDDDSPISRMDLTISSRTHSPAVFSHSSHMLVLCFVRCGHVLRTWGAQGG